MYTWILKRVWTYHINGIIQIPSLCCSWHLLASFWRILALLSLFEPFHLTLDPTCHKFAVEMPPDLPTSERIPLPPSPVDDDLFHRSAIL